MKISCRLLTLNSYKPFLKNKNRSGKKVWWKLSASFSTNFLKKKILLYSITWPLTPNFHHPVKKILLLLPANFHFSPHWENFYNMLFSSFKRFEWSISLLLRFPPPHKNFPSSKIPMSPMGRYPRVSHRCWEHGELQSIHRGGRFGDGGGGDGWNAVEKYLWRSSYVSKVASYKSASL